MMALPFSPSLGLISSETTRCLGGDGIPFQVTAGCPFVLLIATLIFYQITHCILNCRGACVVHLLVLGIFSFLTYFSVREGGKNKDYRCRRLPFMSLPSVIPSVSISNSWSRWPISTICERRGKSQELNLLLLSWKLGIGWRREFQGRAFPRRRSGRMQPW